MIKAVFAILFLYSIAIHSQPCFELNDGKGLSLFSPFLKTSPRFKQKGVNGSFGDTSLFRSCNSKKRKAVLNTYLMDNEEPVFAAHSGTVNLYTSVNSLEDNQAVDALWIDGGQMTTSYIGLKPVVQTGQYIYAGQLIGRVFKESYGILMGFGIRRASPVNPIHKRGFLPVEEGVKSTCLCNSDPVWPEYFVNSSGQYIAYDRYNESLPEAAIKITIEPGGIGKWSFDNGITWLNSGEKISGLPYGFYKIIFKDEYGYSLPPPIEVNTLPNKREYESFVNYIPDYSILKKPDAELQREADKKLADKKYSQALDSINNVIHANDRSIALRDNILDSLNTRFTNIENLQKETFFLTRLFKYILPVLTLAVLFIGILFFQNNKIRKQKKYLENLQKEQHHRVHNSLGLVSSLLNTYKQNISPEKLADIDNSIIAISTVHRQLYKGEDIEYIDFQPIAESIAQSLLSQRQLMNTISVNIDAHIVIPQKISTLLALIYNELFTNSLKYAFNEGAAKQIFLSAIKKDGHIVFIYRDNGNGYPLEFITQKTNGFGRVLITGLAHQLRAKLYFYNESGACCMLNLKL